MPKSKLSPQQFHAHTCWDPDCIQVPTAQFTTANGALRHTCGNHQIALIQNLATEEFTPGVCLLCQTTTHVVTLDDTGWIGQICRAHLIAYESRTLSPAAFERMMTDAGGDPESVFNLHEDFYTDDGVAYQPDVPLPSTQAYLAKLPTLPVVEDEETGYDAEAFLEVASHVRTDYATFGGPVAELTDSIIRTLAGELIFNQHHNTRPFGPVKIDLALHERIRLVLEEQHPAPPHLGPGDTHPYRREAAWITKRLTGRTDDHPLSLQKFARIVATAFFRGRVPPPITWNDYVPTTHALLLALAGHI